MNQEMHWFERGAKFSFQKFPWLIRKNNEKNQRNQSFFDTAYLNALHFSGFDLTVSEIEAFSYFVAITTFLLFVIFDVCLILSYIAFGLVLDILTILLVSATTLGVPLVLMNLIASYPKTYVRYAKIHSLGDIPEVLSYLVMYLKLVPNIEHSVKFAVQESSTSLVKDLRKMIWDLELRVYHGINDALSHFAHQWGQWSDHFKRSLHLIRSSVDEPEEAQRIITLNKALDVGLEGTRNIMYEFAEKLHQPTMVIYSIGIMIPLSIIAMLPAAGLIGLQVTIFQVFLLYDILLPLLLFLYMRNILLSRPATFNPPQIPHNHPKLHQINRQKETVIASVIGVSIALPGILLFVVPLFFPNSILFNYALIGIIKMNDFLPATLCIIWGVTAGISWYLLRVYHPFKLIRDEIKHIEQEFGDALYIIGKRIGEQKSPEESFLYTSEIMKGSPISTLFQKTGYNLSAFRTTINHALFHTEYGSLKHIYSYRIKAIMRLFVEGIKKGQQSLSLSLIRLADHLKELQQVERTIKETLSSLTSTLRATAMIFAPIIAGVTISITKLISLILSSMTESLQDTNFQGGSTILSGVSQSFRLENIEPSFFILIIGIYVIELVILLTRFTNGIDEGDDRIEFYYLLGKTLPVAIFIFTVSIIVSHWFFSSIAVTL